MTDLAARLALKERLPRTWPAFFERHGNFTPIQVATIPAVLDGQNVIVCAPTASGKTEAAIAPLIERYCPPGRSCRGLRILYLTPTRALVNDLHARLAHPLQSLGVTLGVKTGDRSTFRADRPPDVLITTPESTDSALATHAKLFAHLRAIVIDELHLLHGTPRGDQVRVLLSRIGRIRQYALSSGDAVDTSGHTGAVLHYAALSATLADPQAVAALYVPNARTISVGGTRVIKAEQIALAPPGIEALLAYLRTFQAKGWRKALAFCNTRAEVEAYAAAIRARSPFGDAVYVHYSNIDAMRRREIEQHFAADAAAICFASSTLELGIDIGDIDVVLLIGPPGNPGSFIQRIGRGNRRQGMTHVACFHRTPLERLIFDVLVGKNQEPRTENQEPRTENRPSTDDERPATTDHRRWTMDDGRWTMDDGLRSTVYGPWSMVQNPFRPAVAIQQIFSLLKQSPLGAVRLAELASLFASMLAPTDLQAIVSELQLRNYLQVGRPGEWRAGPRLNKLIDEQASAQPILSIYSNIEGNPASMIDIRDQHTRQRVARVDAQWLDRPVITLEGRPVKVEWYDGDALWVAASGSRDIAEQLYFRSTRQLLSYALARSLPEQLGLPPGTAPFIIAPEGCWWFHWLGDLYGRAALDLLRYHLPATATEQIGLCLRLPVQPQAPPAWTEAQVSRYLADNYRQFEPLLALGPFHHLLPVPLRRRAVVEQFDVAQFLEVVAALRPVVAPAEVADDLLALLAAD